MQICSYANLFAGITLATVMAFSACASQPTPEPAAANEPADSMEEAESDMPEPPADTAEEAAAGGGEDPAAAAPAGEGEGAAGGGETGRSLAEIQQIVKANRQPVRDCYEKALKELPDLKGDLTIHFVIKPDGTVKEAKVNQERSTLKSPAVATCAMDVIKGLKFPADERGMETTVNYPYNFNP